MNRFALALFCVFLLALTTASGAVTVQITVLCNGGVVYDNAVTVTKTNPTAWDALQASGVVDDYELEGHALNAGTGEMVWSYPAGGSSPAVAGGMVFSIGSGKVYAFGQGGGSP